MTKDQHTQQDPTRQYPQLEFGEQRLEHPGLESEMQPKPGYGEETYRGSGKLTGKAAIITGGDSGIGRAVALAFAREGADVLISYLESEEPDAQETVQAVEGSGRKAVAVPGDIQDEALCREIVERGVSELGKVDVLVNNAAYQMARNDVTEIPSEEFERTFRTNVFAMFYLCKAAIPHMQPGSSIINTCSIEAYQPLPMLLDYSSAKGAIITFTKALAQELISQGIRATPWPRARCGPRSSRPPCPPSRSRSSASRSLPWGGPPNRLNSRRPTSFSPLRSLATSTARPWVSPVAHHCRKA
jgi:NADP-dependent 3-hydroxy acid dehydrogenase YdfG